MALRRLVVLLGYKVDRRSERRADQSVATLKRAAAGLAASFGLALGAREVVRAFTSTIDLASSATETLNKLGAVFGDNADAMSASMTQLADQTNRSTNELTEMAAQAGALLTPLLRNADATREMSTEMVGLAQDVSSFFDARPQDAFRALRSALIGSTEPLLTLTGIDTRVAAIQEFANVTAKQFKDMSTAEKTALRFELVMQRLGEQGAIGDAARTAFEGANAFRGMRAAMTDIGTVIGQAFLPAVTRSVVGTTRFVRDLIRGARAGGRFQRILQIGANTMSQFGRVLDLALRNAGTLAAALGSMIVLLSPFTALVVLAGAAIALLADDFEQAEMGGESFIESVLQGFQMWIAEIDSVGEAFEQLFENAGEFWLKFLSAVTGAPLEGVREELKATVNRALKALGLEGGLSGPGRSLTPQEILASPQFTPAERLAARNQLSQQNRVEVNVNTQDNPQAVATATGGALRNELDRSLRDAQRAFTPAAP